MRRHVKAIAQDRRLVQRSLVTSIEFDEISKDLVNNFL
jgi:hypothetical protein